MTAAQGISRRRFLGGLAATTGMAALGVAGLGASGRAYAAAGLTRGTATTGPVMGTSTSLASMLGVCAVTSTTKGIWGNHDVLVDRIRELGATAVRDCLFGGNNGQLAFLNQLASAGIGANLIMGDPRMITGTPEQLVSLAASRLTGVSSFEGANEWNLSGQSAWVSQLKSHQSRLYAAVKADGRVSSRPVLAPSLGCRSGFSDLGNISSICDNGNLHLYPGGFPPSNRVDEQVQNEGIVAPGKPVVFTECGYHDAKNSTATHFYTPDNVAALYAPRLLLEHYLRGVRRSFLYQIMDREADPGLTNHEDHFGLLHADYTRKPQFVALKNLLSLARDPGATTSTVRPLGHTLTGAPDDLRQVLLQRSDGSYLLFLWRDVSVYDPRNRVGLPVRPATVSVALPSPSTVAQYRPSSSLTATGGATGTTRTSVTLSAEVVALHVEP